MRYVKHQSTQARRHMRHWSSQGKRHVGYIVQQTLLKRRDLLRKRNQNILHMSIRKLLIWESCIYYLIFTKGTQLFLEDNFFQTAKFLQKHYPSFQRTNLNQLCKRVNLTINRRCISLKRLKYEYSSGKCESS